MTNDSISKVGETTEIVSANVIQAYAFTNGFKGGNHSHGSITQVRIKDEADTCIDYIRILNNEFGNVAGFEMQVSGDCELQTMIDAFRFIADSLERQSRKENA